MRDLIETFAWCVIATPPPSFATLLIYHFLYSKTRLIQPTPVSLEIVYQMQKWNNWNSNICIPLTLEEHI